MCSDGLYDISEDENLLLKLLEETLIWCPQHIMDLCNLVHLIGSREERIQAEIHGFIMTCLPQQSVLHGVCLTFVYARAGRQAQPFYKEMNAMAWNVTEENVDVLHYLSVT